MRIAPLTASRDGSGGARSELEAFERARAPPLVDVLEVRDGAERVAGHPEPGSGVQRLTLVVVVARGAVGVAEERERAAVEQFHPCPLGLGRPLALLRAGLERVADDRRDRPSGVAEVR